MPADATTRNLATELRALRSGEAGPVCGGDNGFEEGRAPFATGSRDDQRFSDSLRLQRTFALIESEPDRQLLLKIAELLASASRR